MDDVFEIQNMYHKSEQERRNKMKTDTGLQKDRAFIDIHCIENNPYLIITKQKGGDANNKVIQKG
jgi:hypothetical protein